MADEGDGGKAVPEAHLAEGVGDVDLGFGCVSGSPVAAAGNVLKTACRCKAFHLWLRQRRS